MENPLEIGRKFHARLNAFVFIFKTTSWLKERTIYIHYHHSDLSPVI